MEGPGWAQAVGWHEEECPAGPCTFCLSAGHDGDQDSPALAGSRGPDPGCMAGALPELLICKARGMSRCSQQHL